ncbi:MAG: 4Fe-4S binding protein [Deltaproteobacteria bacterium]|nr:4Fe-4S binding protein [Deltaproteobacteria bacterium]
MNVKPSTRELALGAAILTPGSAREYHTGGWRTFYPKTDEALCITCGLCWIFCPDACRVITKRENPIPGVLPDYYDFNPDYCKGCGICAQECPTGAIRMIEEGAP